VSFALIAILAGAAILGSPWVRDRAEQLAQWASGKSRSPANAETGTPSTSTVDSIRALDGLIVVAERPEVPGYQRGCAPGEACSFGPAWTDDSTAPDGHNGCGTRDDVLREQLADVVFRAGSGCVVAGGTLHDPYTSAVIPFSKTNAAAVQIDHVYPLARAFDMGAAGWSQERRTEFANDTGLELLAVDGRANRAKGDSGPAEWLPPNPAEACGYLRRYIDVAATYELAITAAEHHVMARILTGCG
jgi:hypothetical protein